MTDSNQVRANPWLWYCVWLLVSSLLFIKPILALGKLSLSQDDSSYLILIPFISAAVLWLERRKVFLRISMDKSLGAAMLLLAACFAFLSFLAANRALPDWQLSGWILTLAILWVAGFAFLFGRSAVKAASFPLLFLLLMVPIPNFLLDRIILALQKGSAWITGALFDLTGVPALRDGLVFHLPRVSIEVAKECSGISSSMALLILTLLVAHFRLKNRWHKALFVVCGLLMMIVKNGIRIASLTLLAIYVDPGFLFGRLHHQGGVVFFVLALLLLLPLLSFVERRESRLNAPIKQSSV